MLNVYRCEWGVKYNIDDYKNNNNNSINIVNSKGNNE